MLQILRKILRNRKNVVFHKLFLKSLISFFLFFDFKKVYEKQHFYDSAKFSAKFVAFFTARLLFNVILLFCILYIILY